MRLLSIVVPVYNEELNIEPLYRTVNSTLKEIAHRYDWEFVFTDNCSTDGTFERLEQLATQDARVRAYRLTRNFGFHRHGPPGVPLAGGDGAVQMVCAFRHPPQLTLEFVRHWEAGHKVVFGVRRSRPEPLHLRTLRRLFYRLIAALSDDELPHD